MVTQAHQRSEQWDGLLFDWLLRQDFDRMVFFLWNRHFWAAKVEFLSVSFLSFSLSRQLFGLSGQPQGECAFHFSEIGSCKKKKKEKKPCTSRTVYYPPFWKWLLKLVADTPPGYFIVNIPDPKMFLTSSSPHPFKHSLPTPQTWEHTH